MGKKAIETKKAPQSIGPYSQAVQAGNFIFCSGQVGKDPKTNAFVAGGIEVQTKQVLENLKAVLGAVGTSFAHVVKTTVYLKNVADFPKMNEIYASYFQPPYPARATVEVARLPQDALIEIECIAYVENNKGNEGGCDGECSCCG